VAERLVHRSQACVWPDKCPLAVAEPKRTRAQNGYAHPTLPVLRFGKRLSPHAAEAGGLVYLLEVWSQSEPRLGPFHVLLQEM